MPRDRFGIPQIVFAVEDGGDQRFSGYIWIATRRGARTCQQIANKRGSPEDAVVIKRLNGIRNVNTVLDLGRELKIPDRLRNSTFFSCLPGEEPPIITGGYANIDTIARGQRRGLSLFTGYDPLQLSVPIRFEAYEDEPKGSFSSLSGQAVEEAIAKLEMMAGRGSFQGNAVGAPPIVQVSVTDGNGVGDVNILGLIPRHAQRFKRSQDAPPKGPVYWIAGIEWGDAWRNGEGNRIRQFATVSLTEYVRPDPLGRKVSVAERSKERSKKNRKKTAAVGGQRRRVDF